MSDEQRRRGTGQTFLVGDELYLRGLEAADAKFALAWRDSPFPVPSARAERQLKDDVPKEAEKEIVTLVACRIGDDAPVGAVRIDRQYPTQAFLALHAAPALGAEGAAVRAAILDVVLGWLRRERTPVAISVDLDADEPEVRAVAEGAGMRLAARLREALWRDGGRHDQVIYEWLNPTWVTALGDPDPGIARAGEPVAAPGTPAPAGWPPVPERLEAVMAGERVVLRAREVEDAEPIARSFHEETETFFNSGRLPFSPLVFADVFRKLGEHEPPAEIEFSIVLRDGGTMIGENGLYWVSWVHRTAETGSYIYRPEHRGGGLGTEAKHLLLAYAFDTLGLHMVRSFVNGRNKRSAAALRKQGYRDAGRLRWIDPRDARWVDALVFDLLAEEWRAARDGSARSREEGASAASATRS